MNRKQNANAITVEKARLNQARMLAMGRNDHAEVAQIDKQLTALTGDPAPARPPTRADDLARLNERNRKANIEAARKAEMLEAERKRRERKLAAAANGTATPPLDRVKMLKNAELSRFVLIPTMLSGLLRRHTDVNQISCYACMPVLSSDLARLEHHL